MSATTTLVQRYSERAGSPLFLASFFRTPPGNMVKSEKIKIHVRRAGRKIAVALRSIDENGRENRISEFTIKEMTPPAYKENITISSSDLWNQEFGRVPDDPVDHAAFLNRGLELGIEEIVDILRRGFELQCAQVLQTGTMDLTDEDGSSRFTLDFQPKSSHFVNASANWPGSTAKLTDMSNLQETIRVDGKRAVKHCVFGRLAWQDFKADDDVIEQMNLRRADLINIERPKNVSEDANWHGKFVIDHNEVNLWTYQASYEDPETGDDTRYVADENIIMLPEAPEFDLRFGAVPRIPKGNDPDRYARVVTLPEKGITIDSLSWVAKDRTSVTVQLAVRALAIPTAIDTFGCLYTRS